MWEYPPETPAITIGTMVVDWDRALVTVADKKVKCSWKEITLLAALGHAHGRVLTTAWLIETLWPDTAASAQNLKGVVCQVRRKLGPERWRLTTVVGVGYRLDQQEVAGPAPSHGDREG